LHAKQARDAYVKQVEHQLANIELEINQLEERAANAEGDEKEELDQQIETLQAQHDRAEDALEELRNADIDDWKVHEQHVRMAMQDLDSGLNNIR
jgi:chaperonin cofactor prefoldin